MCDNFIDPHFLSFLEYKTPDKIKFVRIDADVDGALKDGESAEDSVLAEIFKSAIANDKLSFKFEKLKNTEVSAVIVVDEYMRRYSEMGKYYGMKTDKTYTYCPRPAHSDDEAVMTIHEMKSRDGNVYTILTSVSEMGHSAYPESAQRMWAFFQQFSRNSDGSLAVNPLPLASDVSANAWYADAVRHVLDNGMMTTSGTFSPQRPP